MIHYDKSRPSKKIGSKQGLKSVGIGLSIAQLIMTLFNSVQGFFWAFFWFINVSFSLNIAIGVIIMITLGYFYGQSAGEEILIKKRNCFGAGIKYGMVTLLMTSFLASWIGFFQECTNSSDTLIQSFENYIITPVFSIFIFGFIPVLLVGIWFGWQIKKHENNFHT